MATYNFDKIINRKGNELPEVRLCRGERQACGCAATVGRRHGLYSIGGDYEKPSRGGRSWNLRIHPA